MMTELIAVAVGISVSALIIGAIALKFAILAYAECIGLKNSTHQVQFMPFDQRTEADKDLDDFVEEQNSLEDPFIPRDNDSEAEFIEKSKDLESRRKKKQKFDEELKGIQDSADFMGTNW